MRLDCTMFPQIDKSISLIGRIINQKSWGSLLLNSLATSFLYANSPSHYLVAKFDI